MLRARFGEDLRSVRHHRATPAQGLLEILVIVAGITSGRQFDPAQPWRGDAILHSRLAKRDIGLGEQRIVCPRYPRECVRVGTGGKRSAARRGRYRVWPAGCARLRRLATAALDRTVDRWLYPLRSRGFQGDLAPAWRGDDERFASLRRIVRAACARDDAGAGATTPSGVTRPGHGPLLA